MSDDELQRLLAQSLIELAEGSTSSYELLALARRLNPDTPQSALRQAMLLAASEGTGLSPESGELLRSTAFWLDPDD